MSAHQASFPIIAVARVLGVSTAGYYAWLKRAPSAHAEDDAKLPPPGSCIWLSFSTRGAAR